MLQQMMKPSISQALAGQFELTPHCNLNCKACYIHNAKEAGRVTLPASFWLEQARQAADLGMLVLSLTGGETLLYPGLDELMEGLSKLGLFISFNTNGTLIDEERVAWFLRFCPAKINISLYGASDETYERYCGITDGFTKVSKAVDLLLAAGLNVYLNGMLTPYNLRELAQMHRFAADRKLVLHASAYAFPLRTHPGQDIRGQYRFTPEEAAAAAASHELLTQGPEVFRRTGVNRLLAVRLRQEGILCDACSECNGGANNFQISCDGVLHPCAMYQQVAVSLREHPFAEARELLSRQMQAIPYPEKCNACDRKDLCPVCKAAVYLETGDVTQAPDYLCRYSAAYEQILRKECGNVSGTLQNSGNLHQHSGTG